MLTRTREIELKQGVRDSPVDFTGVLTFDLPQVSVLLSAPFHTPTELLLRNSFDIYPRCIIDPLDAAWFLTL